MLKACVCFNICKQIMIQSLLGAVSELTVQRRTFLHNIFCRETDSPGQLAHVSQTHSHIAGQIDLRRVKQVGAV